MRSDAPGVLGVDSQTLHVLREAAIAAPSGGASHTDRDGRSASGTEIKLRWVGGVKAGIVRIGQNGLGGGGEGAAENRFVNKIDAKPQSVRTSQVAHVVAKLIFFLVAQDRKRGDGSDKLIVAEGFAARDGAARGSKRKIKREAEIRVARGCKMQSAGVQYERTDPVRVESVLLSHNHV